MKDAIDVLAGSASKGFLKVLCADLTQDTFTVIKEDSQLENGTWRKCSRLSDYFAAFVDSGFVHMDDVNDFRKYTSLQYLTEFFRVHHGRDIHWLNYRRKTAEGYRWSVMEMVSAESYTDDREMVYLFVKDIQASLSNQSANMSGVLRALCGRYDSIYCLDLQQGSVETYRAYNHDNPRFDAFIRTNPDYRDLVTRYIAASVLPEDRAHVLKIMDMEFIREYLSVRSSYSGEYRTVYDGEVHWYRVVFSRLDADSSLRYVAIGLSDISVEKRMESDLYRNSKAILLASSDCEARESLRDILEHDYPLLEADSCDAAMQLLNTQHENIAVVIADAALENHGCEVLLRSLNAERYLRNIPVLITDKDNSRSEELIALGASDFLCRPYRAVLVKNRVSFMVHYREASNMLNLLERDPLTGLYSKEFFFRAAEQIMADDPDGSFAILISDVEQFHFYKERYGQKAADEMLRNLAMLGADMLKGYLAGGRINDDVFAYLIRYSPEVSEDVCRMQHSASSISSAICGTVVSVKYGMYVVDEKIPVSAMCDRGVLAVKSIKGVYGTDLASFDIALREELLKNQQIIENAEDSLDRDQFLVFYQPKHDIQHGGVGGAEAVIRWIHPILGFMNPMSFIPLFERNGFIEVLDRFVLRRVCQDLVEWQKNGDPVVPISVNISRVDFDKEGLADKLISIVDSYGLDHSLIHIEITESGYAEDPDGITREIGKLHENGFIIELDDFGTGYSSLSALSALPVDVLKLDMSLLRQDDEVTSRNILEFSMKLAKIMKMQTVQEGVETQEQLERVSSLGCDHVQGFYFSKPLPKEEYIQYCRMHQMTAIG